MAATPEKTRLYEVNINEPYDAAYSDSCRVAAVTVKSESANEAIRKALKKVKNEIKLDKLFASSVRCIDCLSL